MTTHLTNRTARAFLIVSRVEYMPSAINEVGIPACLALLSTPFSSSFVALTLVGLVIWWLAHWIGSHINCLSDYEVDRKYKVRLPEAIEVIGKKNLKIIIVVEIVVTTAIVFFLSAHLQKPLLIVLWFVGLAFAFGYSVIPFRFKGKKLWNPFALAVVLYVCPMLFEYHLLSSTLDALPILVIFLFVLQMIPMFFVDEVSDYEEDQDVGIETPCVFYGRFKVTVAALVIYIVSTIAMIGVFLSIHQPSNRLALFIVPIVVLGYAKVIIDFYQLARMSHQFEAASDQRSREGWARRIKKAVKTPVWLMSTGIAVIGLCASILL